MQHLENIKKMFSKNFVEHPLVETFDAGKINLPSGQLVACDPILTSDMLPFTVNFPAGDFPVYVHKERESGCIAYVEIAFNQDAVTRWEMALTEGQNLKELAKEEIFGYPVESGMGCFMDVQTQAALNKLELDLYNKKGDDFEGIYAEFFHSHFFDTKGAIDQFAFLKPSSDISGTIFAFETGYGEGFYASYIGYNEKGQVAKIVTEFIEIEN